MVTMPKPEQGHPKLLVSAKEENLRELVALTSNQRGAISAATTDYIGKVFEHPAGEVIQGCSQIPDVSEPFGAGRLKVGALRAPCCGD